MNNIFELNGYIFMPVEPAKFLINKSRTIKRYMENDKQLVVSLNDQILTVRSKEDIEPWLNKMKIQPDGIVRNKSKAKEALEKYREERADSFSLENMVSIKFITKNDEVIPYTDKYNRISNGRNFRQTISQIINNNDEGLLILKTWREAETLVWDMHEVGIEEFRIKATARYINLSTNVRN